MSVDTYGAQETRVYYVVESSYGVTPSNPSMLGVASEGPQPSVDPGLIKVLGIGSRDLQAIYAGVRKVKLKIPHVPSQQAPITRATFIDVLRYHFLTR